MAAISLISTFLMVLCLYGYGTEAQEVVRIGNEIKASMSGINTAGNIVLLNDIVFSEGILYAFAAFFRSQKEAVLQIWAPIDNDSNYKLVYEMPHLPSVTMAREDIYIAAKLNKKCLRVENGYRVGVYFREEPTSISYTFQKNNPKVLRHELVNSSDPIRVGSNVKFDSLAFPYAFSLAGYILKVKFNSTDNETLVDCPQTLLIPEYADVTITSTTAPPRTGAPGATGATGPQGGAGGTGLPGFPGAAGSAGATGALGPMGINGTMGSGGYTGATGPAGNDGGLGATGIQGPSGGKGIPGPPGPPGPAGGKGTGAGNDTNTVVKPKPVVAASTFADPMMVMGLLIWLIIVTILIIIVFIIICCCLLRRRRHKEEHTAYYAKGINGEGEVGIKADSHYGMNGGGAVSAGSLKRVTSTTSATSVPDEAWMGTLKGDTDTVYSTDTIDDRRKKSAKEAEDGKGGYENGYENVGFENEKSDVFISNGQPVEEGLTGF